MHLSLRQPENVRLHIRVISQVISCRNFIIQVRQGTKVESHVGITRYEMKWKMKKRKCASLLLLRFISFEVNND